jgi:hypothetical protein
MFSVRKALKENFRDLLHDTLADYHVPNAKLEKITATLTDDKLMAIHYLAPDLLDVPLSFRLNKQNEGIYQVIVNEELKDKSLSSFFRDLIDQYLHMQQSERERLLFFDGVRNAEDCIREGRLLRIYQGKEKSKLFRPYRIQENMEHTFIYLYGMEEGNSQPESLHLYKIGDFLGRGNGYYDFSKDELKLLKKHLEGSGVQFACGTPLSAKVKVDGYGAKMVKAIYLNRPLIVDEEKGENDGKIITFLGSFENICQYVYRLNEHAFVLSPASLAKYVYRIHKRSYEFYKEQLEERRARLQENKTEKNGKEKD